MAHLQPTHRRLLLEAYLGNAEANPVNYGDIEYLNDLEEWEFVDKGFVLTNKGSEAAINIQMGLVVQV